jgi:hypothetical protein
VIGILIGLCSFLLIGLFHPIVIKAEYYFSKRIYPVFILTGLLFLSASYFTAHTFFSAIFGVTGFSCFWSIKELFEQEKRVEKGWFPKNPKRK